ncbi:hypothetical protein [Phenylobacterium sp. J367]|uniref:DUF6894 family protein n=1 Tax=Phenylobacterium sp. J367 TaxID=2898435 RepID=UPI0035AFC519
MDGHRYPDHNGIELDDLAAVRRHALRVMGEMSEVMGDDVWQSGQMRVTVKDDAGLTLLTLDVIATRAAAMPKVNSA